MVRTLVADFLMGCNKKYMEYAGNSNDAKPLSDIIATGSVFIEVDTGSVYMFDEDNSEWYSVSGGGNNDSGNNDPGLPIMDGVVAN